MTMTNAQLNAFASALASALTTAFATLPLAQLQQATTAPAQAPKQPKQRQPKAQAPAPAPKPLTAKQQAGLARVTAIAQAKATKGKLVLTDAIVLAAVRAQMGVALPEGTTRFTVTIADKGFAFTPAGMVEVALDANRAAVLRTLYPQHVVRKAPQA